MVLKRCTISLLSRHLGLEESKITGHSNKREKLQGSQEGYPKGPNRKLESRTPGLKRKWTYAHNEQRLMTNIAGRLESGEKITEYLNQIFTCCLFIGEEKEITGLSNLMFIRLSSRHGLEKVKLQGRKWYQMLFHFLKRSEKAKLQSSQEYRPHPKPMVIWKEIELQWHDTQTSYWQRAVWKRIKLQGSQASCRSLIRV